MITGRQPSVRSSFMRAGLRSRRGCQSRSDSKSSLRRRPRPEHALAAPAGAVDRTVFITGRFGDTLAHCVGRPARGWRCCVATLGPRSDRCGPAGASRSQRSKCSLCPANPGARCTACRIGSRYGRPGLLGRRQADQRMRSVSFHVKPETVVPPPVATDHTLPARPSDG